MDARHLGVHRSGPDPSPAPPPPTPAPAPLPTQDPPPTPAANPPAVAANAPPLAAPLDDKARRLAEFFNGEVVELDGPLDELTGDELKAFKAQQAKDLAEANARQAEADAKIAARASALAKLADLGLTAEEIAAL